MRPTPDADADGIAGISVKLVIGHSVPDYDPALMHKQAPLPASDLGGQPDYFYYSPYLPGTFGSLGSVELSLSVQAQTIGDFPDPGPVITVTPNPPVIPFPQPPALFADGPGSVIAVTLQSIGLNDDDILLDGLGGNFVDPGDLQKVLNALDDFAGGLQGFEIPDMPQMDEWMPFVEAVFDQLGSAPLQVSMGHVSAEIHVFRAEDASGTIVNGEMLDEAPSWQDMLPLFMRSDDDKASADEADNGDAEEGDTVIRTTSGMDGETEISYPVQHDFSRDFPGREASEAAGSGHHVVTGANSAINDIAVASQWIDASLIVVQGDVAKLQAISQVNLLVEHDSIEGEAVVQDSTGMNIAEILQTSVPAGGSAAAEDLAAPGNWHLFRIEATLYQVNWVKQVTYVTDFDRVEVTYSAQMTMLVMGANETSNSSILNELGHRFDVIFVAGDMIDATIISQTNVLYDSDAVTGVNGDPSGAGISLGDNLLFNSATIDMRGVDSFAPMTENVAQAARDLSAGTNTLAQNLGDQSMLAGRDHVLALQIEGDLVRVNIFEQENIIGDADQLRLDMEHLQAELAAEASLVAGSNLLVNAATVTEYGVDSTIMAGGHIYDDALIHQAEWFDNDAAAEGVRMAELTTDAVAAFLNDEAARIEDHAESIMAAHDYDSVASMDVMQSVLA